MRERPLRERKPRKRIEEDAAVRAKTAALFPAPEGTAEFKEGYRECIELYALHAPDRAAGRILDEHRVTLEDACLRANMARTELARYEGYRQAMKDLRSARRIR